MIGVFDSGAGGLFALAELRRLKPKADITFLADRKNAPYGNKSQSELIGLVKSDIERLVLSGCERVLIACCTASTVYDLLPVEYREISVPIISPTARLATEKSINKRIGILSTEATEKSRAFVEKIKKYEPMAWTVSAHAPELVALAEAGERDGGLSALGSSTVEKCVSVFCGTGIDTLILGCTHFAYFENKIKDILCVETVNSAVVGASVMRAYDDEGEGRTVFLT
ncbi:MAG: hypothetical protein E7673_02530 [Ruminococcaceae bacterium]|nr:hypothetical protein [Oscillospiraceae bacterium]